MALNDVHDELVERQTGEFNFDDEPVVKVNPVSPNKFVPLQRDYSKLSLTEDEENEEILVPDIGFRPDMGSRTEDYSAIAPLSGWGESRYDRGDFNPDADLEDTRAKNQPGFWKVMNGGLKGGVTAATTYASTIGGSIEGLLEGAYEMGREIVSGEKPSITKSFDAGVNNFVSRSMLDVQKYSEKLFPNYRTQEERSDQYQDEWWKHMATANFVGDAFLKNLGFTVGAMYAGKTFSKVAGKKMARKYSGDVMRGVVAAAESNPEAATILEGMAPQFGRYVQAAQPIVLDKNIIALGRATNEMAAKLQLFGSVFSAIGEGTVEGLMGRQEWLEQANAINQKQFDTDMQNLPQELLRRHPEYGRTAYRADENGNVKKVIELNEDGQRALDEEKIRLIQENNRRAQYANEQADHLASTIFLLNIPVLTASNTAVYGKMFSGGFKTAKRNLSKFTGGIRYTDVGRPIANYGTKATVAGKAALGIAKTGLTESAEEMTQGFISSGAKNVADAKLTSFNDNGYDAGALAEFGDWLRAIDQGGWQFLSDTKNWQEGFLGALTGLLGIPGRRWQGGIIGEVRDARENVRDTKQLAEQLNSAINSDEFVNMMMSYSRDKLFDRQLAQSIENDDRYSWHTADDNKLINLVMNMADAGKLDDLRNLASRFQNMSAEDAERLQVLDAIAGENNQEDIANDPQAALDSVSEQATNIVDVIDSYAATYDALRALMPAETSKAHMQELIFTSMQLKRFEKRFMEMFGETMDSLEGTFKTLSEEDKTELETVRNAYARAFGGILPNKIDALFANSSKKILERLQEVVKDTDNEQRVADMIKLSDDRKAFYDKFRNLREISSNEYQAKAKTPEKIMKQQEQEAAIVDAAEFESAADVKKAYFGINSTNSKSPVRDRQIFIERMKLIRDKNKAVDDFLNLYEAVDDFSKMVASVPTPKITGANEIKQSVIFDSMFRDVVRHLLDNVESLDDLYELNYTAFPTVDDLKRSALLESSFARVSDKELQQFLAESQKYLRGIMDKFMEDRKLTKVIRDHGEFAAPQQGPAAGSAMRAEIDSWKTGAAQNPAPAAPAAPAPAPVPNSQTSGNPETRDEDTRVSEEKDDDIAPGVETKDDQDRAQGKPLPGRTKNEQRGEAKSSGKVRYYRGALGEFTQEMLKKIRGLRDARKWSELNQLELKTLAEENPAFADVYNALVKKNAFNNMSRLRKGDKIKFLVMPETDSGLDNGFPTYKGDPQILMAVEKNGEMLILNVLCSDTDSTKYFGNKALRDRIMQDYRRFKDDYDQLSAEQKEGRYFVFSKESTVWSTPRGAVVYNENAQDTRIDQLEGFDKDAPIIIVDRMRKARNLRTGNIVNISLPRGAKRGSIYYLMNTGSDYNYPILLTTQHFTGDTKNHKNPVFDKIRNMLGEVAKTANEAAENVAPPANSSEQEKNRFDAQMKIYRDNLKDTIKELSRYLDLHRVAFTLGVEKASGEVTLKITPDYYTSEEQKEMRDNGEKVPGQKPFYFHRGRTDLSNISADNVINFVSGLNKSINISVNKTSPQLLDEFINSGMLMSNAKKMRDVGQDFYIYSWDAGVGDFLKFSTQEDAINDTDEPSAPAEEVKPQEELPKEEAPVEEPKPKDAVPVEENEEEKDDDEEDEDEETRRQYQVVGARRTDVSPETKEAVEKQRAGRWVKIRDAENSLVRELRKANGITNMRMRDSKLRSKLISVGLSKPVVDFIIYGINQKPALRGMSPYEAFVELSRLMSYDLLEAYDKGVASQVDEALENHLAAIMDYFGVTINKTDLEEAFGKDNIAGAYDVVEKAIWLADNPNKRNGLTFVEEFAHAFIELMGSSIQYGSDSEDFKYLYNTVIDTKLYEHVYEKYKSVYKDENGDPDEYRIRKEAIGQALAAAIKHNWDERKMGYAKKEQGFWGQLKEWFNKILDHFRGQHLSFETVIDEIANEVLDNNLSRLSKVDDTGFNVLDYEKTLENQNALDGGKAVRFMRYFSGLGNIITGSLAYRRQGLVYRSKLDSLHDIDMVVPPAAHGVDINEFVKKYGNSIRRNPEFFEDVKKLPYFQKILQQYPEMKLGAAYYDGRYITVNAIYSEDENLSNRFLSMTGSYADRLSHFTEEERQQIYLFDFFMHKNDKVSFDMDEENGLRLAKWQHPMKEKLIMGRAKDIYDYQMWRSFKTYSQQAPNPTDLLFQVSDTDYQQKAVDRHIDAVKWEVSKTIRNGRELEEISKAMIIASANGPKAVGKVMLAADNWFGKNSSVAQNASDFRDILNSIFTYSEKYELEQAMSEIYGTAPENINIFDVMHDYYEWRLNKTLPGSAESAAVLERAFTRIAAVENCLDTVKNTLSQVNEMVDMRLNEFDKSSVIGAKPSTSNWSDLTDFYRQALLESGWTEEDYNKASKELQDKALMCAGI